MGSPVIFAHSYRRSVSEVLRTRVSKADCCGEAETYIIWTETPEVHLGRFCCAECSPKIQIEQADVGNPIPLRDD